MVSVLLLVWLSISSSASNAQTVTGQLDPTQVYNTGNIVQDTPYGGISSWTNGVYQDNLTCWAWGDPGYCGPNAIVRPGNNINFSFGYTDLNQIQSIASVLPNSGTGLRINGYNFGFTAKNGNGWDGGNLDYLTAYVNFYDPKGILAYNKNYDLNYQFNWTTFNFSENFTKPYASKDLGTVQYGFVGKDNNNWAGPYGPEIYNISFSLKYSVDPCYVNILSSPSCPGYLEELAKLNNVSSSTLATVNTTPTTTTTITNDPVQPVSTSYSAPTTSSVQATPVQTTASNSPSEKTVSGPSISTILGIVRSEQSRIAGVESSAVQQANETASKLANTAKEQGESVAASLTTTSISSSMNSVQGIGQTSSGFSVLSPTLGLTLPGASQPGLQVQSLQQRQIITENKTEENRSNQETEVIRTDSINFVGSNPINDYLEQKPVQDNQNTTTTREATVKKDVQDSDIAGGVTLSAMAKLPVGYELYSVAIKDSNFYAPKEIYKNQRIVDNDRIQRMMNSRSDKVHQEMVDEQYR